MATLVADARHPDAAGPSAPRPPHRPRSSPSPEPDPFAFFLSQSQGAAESSSSEEEGGEEEARRRAGGGGGGGRDTVDRRHARPPPPLAASHLSRKATPSSPPPKSSADVVPPQRPSEIDHRAVVRYFVDGEREPEILQHPNAGGPANGGGGGGADGGDEHEVVAVVGDTESSSPLRLQKQRRDRGLGEESPSNGDAIDPPRYHDVWLRIDVTEGCGGRVWPAAELLGAYIAHRHRRSTPRTKAPPPDASLGASGASSSEANNGHRSHGGTTRRPKLDAWHGKKIVELGAGTGLVGLLVARMGLGAEVWITDQKPMLELMRENVRLNQPLPDPCHVAELNWGEPIPADVPSKPDVVLLADCVYLESAFEPLITTLLELCRLPTSGGAPGSKRGPRRGRARRGVAGDGASARGGTTAAESDGGEAPHGTGDGGGGGGGGGGGRAREETAERASARGDPRDAHAGATLQTVDTTATGARGDAFEGQAADDRDEERVASGCERGTTEVLFCYHKRRRADRLFFVAARRRGLVFDDVVDDDVASDHRGGGEERRRGEGAAAAGAGEERGRQEGRRGEGEQWGDAERLAEYRRRGTYLLRARAR